MANHASNSPSARNSTRPACPRPSSNKRPSVSRADIPVPVLGLTVLVTFMVACALLQYGSSVHRKIYKRISIGALIFLGVIVVAVSIARLLGLTEVWYIGALISIGTRSLAQWVSK